MSNKDIVVEKLYNAYKIKGFTTSNEIYDICDKYDLSIFETDYVTNKIYDMGVLVDDQAVHKEVNNSKDTNKNENRFFDHAQVDYNRIYKFFIINFPKMKFIINLAKRTPPIQHGEVNTLIMQIKGGNNHAKDILFHKYIRLALKFTYNYRKKTAIPLEDIFQVACMGIIKAIDSYDPYQNSMFTSYCSTWIMQGIERFIADKESFVRIPVHVHEKLRPLNKDLKRFRNCNDNELISLIMNSIGETFEKSQQLLKFYKKSQNVYIEDIVGCKGNIDIKSNFDVEEIIVYHEIKERIEDALSMLTPREASIIKMRFGLSDDGEEKTLDEISEIYDITRERVRQIENKAFRRLRHSTISRKIYYYLQDD